MPIIENQSVNKLWAYMSAENRKFITDKAKILREMSFTSWIIDWCTIDNE